MTNYKGESFPENLKLLTKKSYEIAEHLKNRLNQSNCPTLQELYYLKNTRRYKNKALFEKLGYGTISTRLKGLYVFGEQKSEIIEPVYIGISRDIHTRLKQHGWRERNNEATLAYLITKKKYRYSFKLEEQEFAYTVVSRTLRKHVDIDERAKNDVRQFKVAIIPIESDYELYFHEVAIAGILKTEWNSFRTH